MQLTIKIISLFLLTILTSCMAPKAISTIESSNYDDKTNVTTFSKLPFGSIGIPGKWTKVSYNEVSGQPYYWTFLKNSGRKPIFVFSHDITIDAPATLTQI